MRTAKVVGVLVLVVYICHQTDCAVSRIKTNNDCSKLEKQYEGKCVRLTCKDDDELAKVATCGVSKVHCTEGYVSKDLTDVSAKYPKCCPKSTCVRE